MKKMLSMVVLCIVSLLGFFSSTFAGLVTKDPTALGGDNSLMDTTQGGRTAGLGLAGAGAGQEDGFVSVVRNGINRVLGILALITLILLLWGGFQMVTAAGDDGKYDEGFKILKQAAFGLLMIGVAWFVVSIIFFVINLITT